MNDIATKIETLLIDEFGAKYKEFILTIHADKKITILSNIDISDDGLKELYVAQAIVIGDLGDFTEIMESLENKPDE